MIPTALIAAAAIIAQAAPAHPSAPLRSAAAPRCDRERCIVEVDLTPRFLAFWNATMASPPADDDARFALWQSTYGFAAVPPGPRGQKIARELLDAAWPRYQAAIPMLRAGAARRFGDPLPTLVRVTELLGLKEPVTVKLVRFVGGFENNAFMVQSGSVPIVNLPVEGEGDQRAVQAHELAHAVHYRTAGLSGGWERSIAQTAFQEGLAMQTARAVVPGRPVEHYTSYRPGWWPAAQARRRAILIDVREGLDRRDADSVWRYTIGKGAAGIEREAYAAGWWIVEQLMKDGMTLAQVAHIPESQMGVVARQAIDRMLAEGTPKSLNRSPAA